MSIPKEYEYAILNLRVKFLETFRRTTTLSNYDLWSVVEYVDKDEQLPHMIMMENRDGE